MESAPIKTRTPVHIERWRPITLALISFFNVLFWSLTFYVMSAGASTQDPFDYRLNTSTIQQNIDFCLIVAIPVLVFPALTVWSMPRRYVLTGILQACVPLISAATIAPSIYDYRSSAYHAFAVFIMITVISLVASVAPASIVRSNHDRDIERRKAAAGMYEPIVAGDTWPPPPSR